MKKLVALLCTATVAATLFCGCGAKEEPAAETATTEATAEETSTDVAPEATEDTTAEEVASEATGDALLENNTFTVGFDAEFPPYGYMDENGEYTGFDLELAEEVCTRNGWTLVKQPIDCRPIGSYTESRTFTQRQRSNRNGSWKHKAGNPERGTRPVFGQGL